MTPDRESVLIGMLFLLLLQRIGRVLARKIGRSISLS